MQVTAEKTEAVRFRKRGGKRKRDGGVIVIENTRIALKNNMKYLGLIRGDWSIRDHLEKVALKAEIISIKMSRLMANKKGPSEKRGNYNI